MLEKAVVSLKFFEKTAASSWYESQKFPFQKIMMAKIASTSFLKVSRRNVLFRTTMWQNNRTQCGEKISSDKYFPPILKNNTEKRKEYFKQKVPYILSYNGLLRNIWDY